MQGRGAWTVLCAGAKISATEDEVAVLKHRAALFSALTPDGPRVVNGATGQRVTLCVAPGVLVRLLADGRRVCSLPSFDVEPAAGMDCFCWTFSLVPYLYQNQSPRTLFGCNVSPQCIQWPATVVGDTYVPAHCSKPLVTTMAQASFEEAGYVEPGEACVVAYCNLEYTYEDCIMVSRASAQRGLFMRTVSATAYCPQEGGHPSVGTTLASGQHPWWKGPRGIVTACTPCPSTQEYAITVTYTEELQSGDKLATLHGQKGVVLLCEAEDMPWIVYNGREVQLDAVISVVSLVKRGTAGQESEGAMGAATAESGRRAFVSHDSPVPPLKTGTLIDGRTGALMTSSTGALSEVSWGVCRLCPLIHISSQKQFYTGSRGHASGSGRTRSARVKLGEMEMQVALAWGLPHCTGRVCCYMLCAALCPGLHTVVLSERPYSSNLVPPLGGAIAYHPSAECEVPPTVAVLAQDLSRCCGVEYGLACDQLMRCNTLVTRGFVALNVDPLGIHSQTSVAHQSKAFICKCKMIDLLRACIGSSSCSRVSIVCLGSNASAVGSVVHSSLRYGEVRVSLHTSKNPVYYHRKGVPESGRIMEGNNVAERIHEGLQRALSLADLPESTQH
ncbi:hypothetical protein CYMTET_32416 [Cymbomonas tetramitiformis]|uniref:DNA-directed RNA polymerase n=1 Tax=Cymbomonas tetramitiformis TaxID=36881 RepID=A0AAE0KRY5_9CHLO|nr:hypothetical protein CYMTET_32416 [Cymbomonas tetramitiformis]